MRKDIEFLANIDNLCTFEIFHEFHASVFFIKPILPEESDQLATFMKVNLVNKVQTLWHRLETKLVQKDT